MSSTLRVLNVEDSESDVALLTRHLKRAGYELLSERVETAESMKAALESSEWDVILCDYSMPRFNALAALTVVKEMGLDIPFIIISSTAGEEVAVEAMRAGAHDYLMKDGLARLVPAIERETREAENRRARRSAEKQLRLQSAVLESAANAIVITDEKGAIIWVNAAFSKSTGYPLEEVLGRNPSLLKSGKQDRAFYREMWQTILSGKVWHDTIINRRKDGNLNHEDLTITPICNSDGKITHFVGIKQDITDKTRAQEALLASEVRYRRLFESAKDGILILDAVSGRIVDVNPFLIEMLGYSKADLLGKELWEIGVFKDVLGSKAAFGELQLQGYIRYEDLPLETRGGVVKQVEFVSNSYLAGGMRVIQCNIRDITERKRAEKALRETNRHLEQALQELQGKTEELTAMTQQLWQASKLATMGELAASVAHELNNPLATMALRAEMLVERSQDESSQTSAQIILNEIDRMAGLVENLLQFSRRSYRQISTVDVADEISNSVNFVSYYLRNRRIKIVTEFAADVPTVQADRQQLRQLFLNLLTNAADAMPDGGTLLTRAVPTKLSEAQSVLIEFVDSGVGIPDANLERIWDSFFTTKPEGKGTGLGLAICRRIAEDHGGTITIDSKVGEGARVRITLPATTNGGPKIKGEKVIVAC